MGSASPPSVRCRVWARWPRALSGALGTNVSDYYNTVPWAVTDSYGPGWVTYRVTGRVSFWWLELSPVRLAFPVISIVFVQYVWRHWPSRRQANGPHQVAVKSTSTG